MPLDAPKFSAVLNGQPYEYWKAMTVARSLERMSGEFTLTLSRKKPQGDIYLDGSIVPGASASIEIDGQPVLVGWVDGVKYDYSANQADITVTGRDKTCDLIDCAATIDDSFEFTNMKLDAIVKKIVAPFSLTVTVAADVGAPFARFAIQPGESAFEAIERACRFRSVMIVSDGIGGVVIVKPHNEKSPGKLVYGENILDGEVTLDEKELFSLYVVKGQAEPVADDTEAEVTATAEGRTTDTGVKRYRPKLITGENQGFDGTLKERAEWEKKVARSRSKKAVYTVQGWNAGQGALWKPNTLVPVEDSRAGLSRDMLIVGCSFTRSERGTVTTLDLALPEAFDIEAQKDTSGKNNENIWAADP